VLIAEIPSLSILVADFDNYAMTFEEFNESLKQVSPPASMPDILKALWYDRKGDWNASHNIAQDIHSPEGSWIHAYLHRKEGDPGNASYWYHKAGKPVCQLPLEKESEMLIRDFLRTT
jgi:hypothetical protein